METVASFLNGGSYWALYTALVLGGFGLPLPEDLVLVTAGIMAQQGLTDLLPTIGVAFVGVLSADSCLFFWGRFLGVAGLRRSWFHRLMPAKRRARVKGLFLQHGGKMVLLARAFTLLRAPTFLSAGAQGMRYREFLLWDSAGLALTVPLTVGLGYTFSANVYIWLEGLANTRGYFLAALASIAFFACAMWALRWRARRAHDDLEAPTSIPAPSVR